ncbi:MAG: alpha/beta hydrolase [Bacteroidetes bacterium]|nr:MAG: alpha/beta hydrolase [Bacteroidota bacterium]
MTARKLIKLSIPVFLLIFAWIFFIPRTYDVLAFEERKGTEYWELSTGSTIGYTKIESSPEEKKSPIIYLHGGPGGRIKDEVIEALRPLSALGHELYFYDQIGSGHSARLDDISKYSVERHKADLLEIIETIKAEKVILIGQSWGCLLAVNFLQHHSEKVERMILGGPGPILPINRSLKNVSPPDSLNLKNPAFTNQEGNKKANNLRSKLMLRWAYILNRKLASDKEADDFFTFLNGELSKSTFCDAGQAERFKGGGGYYSHIMTVKSFYEVEDKRDRLGKINTPVLIIRGQCDNQKWGYAKEYLDLLPNTKLEIIENTGHNLVDGNGEMYLELIGEFISPTNH